ncbi:MAG TPA: sensor domain-containing diguanylate cyclase [Kangiella sp.]
MEREQIKNNGIRLIAVWYNRLLIILLAFLPLSLILYIDHQTSAEDKLVAHDFHVIAIGSSTLFSAFLSYITWRCYKATGEELLRWLVYGFLGFTFIYAPHGFLTHYSMDNIWVFVLYGPASRLVLAFCFLVAMLSYGKMVTPEAIKNKKLYSAIAIFIVINVLVFWVAHLTSVNLNWWRLLAEYLSISIFTGSVLWMLVQKIRGYMSLLYAVAMIWFALSCLSFTVASVWDHQWWLAHIIFSGGFLILSYGVVQAFLTTGSFKTIYSQNELFQQIIHEKKKSEQALIELQNVNQRLEELAATDSLTGVANRREFTRRSEEEMSRSYRNRTDLCLMVIDFDHFKEINDQYGHQAGDKVLKEFVKLTKEIMRPSDLLGRLGGEEFALLLPETNLCSALKVAERLRQYIEGNSIVIGKQKIKLTISIGVAKYKPKVDTVKKWLHRADEMLYQAKDRGRNRVEADSLEQKGEEHDL